MRGCFRAGGTRVGEVGQLGARGDVEDGEAAVLRRHETGIGGLSRFLGFLDPGPGGLDELEQNGGWQAADMRVSSR